MHARDMILVSKPTFCGLGNHLGLFSEDSDQHEWQEHDGGTVEGSLSLFFQKLSGNAHIFFSARFAARKNLPSLYQLLL